MRRGKRTDSNFIKVQTISNYDLGKQIKFLSHGTKASAEYANFFVLAPLRQDLKTIVLFAFERDNVLNFSIREFTFAVLQERELKATENVVLCNYRTPKLNLQALLVSF